jgi:hypothetical protein
MPAIGLFEQGGGRRYLLATSLLPSIGLSIAGTLLIYSGHVRATHSHPGSAARINLLAYSGSCGGGQVEPLEVGGAERA